MVRIVDDLQQRIDIALQQSARDHQRVARLGGQSGGCGERCAFVDDLERNVEAAREVGMCGVWHTGDAAATAAVLSGFLGVELAPPDTAA